ncbi:MAG: T9SS type A sorting domain-containing protein [Bacteroidales bacterium]|nr:T9SS type A sorting domain-containing protein [Bacteroidales bacterium]
MIKKLLSVAIVLLAATVLNAQPMQGTSGNGSHKDNRGGAKNVTFRASDVLFWTGSGSDSAVVVIGWDDQSAPYTPTALVWGVRFSGSVTAKNMLDTIAAYDPRFTFSFTGQLLATIQYIDSAASLYLTPSANGDCYYVNGTWAPDVYANYPIHCGDLMEISETCYFTLTNATPVTPVSGGGNAAPTDATIAASDILYWIGTGSKQLVFVVNWADTALAWGYKFSADSVSLTTVMDNIAAADPRFDYTTAGGYLTDITFLAGTDTLRITPGNYWSQYVNGYEGMGLSQVLHDGDLNRWADPAAGVVVDSVYYDPWGWFYTYVYPGNITAVSIPANTSGPFCGPVGSEGCNAVAHNSSSIKAWATACTIVRGSQDLSNSGAPLVTYGTETEAVGPAGDNTMNVVSLGDGGSATLTFAKPIMNGPGADFAVFENSFNDSFLELAFVEVSSDGQRFVRFPATSLTQTYMQIGGNGSVDPTFINNLAGKFRVGYGTPFDLNELRDSTGLDINNITHVRIVDAVGSIDPQYGTYDAFGHIVNDPFPTVSYSSGFDLDGVGVINPKSEGIDASDEQAVAVYPNPANSYVTVMAGAASGSQATLYDMTGRVVASQSLSAGQREVRISTQSLPDGVYMLRIGELNAKIVVAHR